MGGRATSYNGFESMVGEGIGDASTENQRRSRVGRLSDLNRITIVYNLATKMDRSCAAVAAARQAQAAGLLDSTSATSASDQRNRILSAVKHGGGRRAGGGFSSSDLECLIKDAACEAARFRPADAALIGLSAINSADKRQLAEQVFDSLGCDLADVYNPRNV